MINKKTTVAGRVLAVLMVFALLLAANCCVISASADTLGTTLYVKTTKSSSPYLYFWVEGGASNPTWPGVALVSEGDNVFSYELPYDIGELTGIIVCGGSGGDKLTGDVKNITGNLYDVDADKWSTYDTSSVKIKSFGADLQSPQYVGSKVLLSMSAEGEGKVQYKISAGNTVLSDFSAKNSIAWEPKAAGDYTITFEAKDATGATASRTLAYTIKSVEGAEEPIFLSATPANGSKIQKDSAVTVSVKGAGGEVNNKILFYKTEIVDPNGNVVNTAYYQTGSKVSFQPTLVGDYTVNMYIQNNTVKNTTVMASYTYTSTTDVIDSDSDIIDSDSDSDIIDSDSDSDIIESDSDVIDSDSDSDLPTPNTFGDFDGNGKVELKDAYSIQSSVLAKTTFTAEQLAIADVNHDGKITLKDASMIQRAIAKLIVLTNA